jgi:hypothetical protein
MPDEDPNRAREATSASTLRELAMVLFRRRRVFVCVSGLVLAAAVLYAVAGTKYEADMKVLVRRGCGRTIKDRTRSSKSRMILGLRGWGVCCVATAWMNSRNWVMF